MHQLTTSPLADTPGEIKGGTLWGEHICHYWHTLFS